MRLFAYLVSTALLTAFLHIHNASCGIIRPHHNPNSPPEDLFNQRQRILWDICCYPGSPCNTSVATIIQYMNQYVPPNGYVLEDKIVIDDHKFEYNHPNQSQETIDAFDRLYDMRGVTYADVNADLRQWEVDMGDDEDDEDIDADLGEWGFDMDDYEDDDERGEEEGVWM